jgi:hypothetical protein
MFEQQEMSLLPVTNWLRTEPTFESPHPAAVPRSTSDTIGSPPTARWTIPDGPFAEMLQRINQSKAEAIQTSAELWPNRVEAISDVSGYLKWHAIVRPGGTGHSSSVSNETSTLNLRAGSVRGLAQALICMLDRFHYCQISPGFVDPEDVFQAPEGAVTSMIVSLECFFQRLRCYLV